MLAHEAETKIINVSDQFRSVCGSFVYESKNIITYLGLLVMPRVHVRLEQQLTEGVLTGFIKKISQVT